MRSLGTVTLAILFLALAGPAQATVVGYDITQASASGPPYPAEPILFDVFYDGDPFHVLAVQLFDASYPPEPTTPLPLTLRGGVDGGGASPFRTGRVEFLPGDPQGYPPEPIHFDIFFDIRPHRGGPAILTFAHPPEPFQPPEPFRFDVAFEVVGGGEEAPQVAIFEIGAGQPLRFDNVVIGPPQSPAVHVTFDVSLLQGGQVLDGPAVVLTVRGNVAQVPGPSGAVLVVLGLAGLLVRRASRRPAGAG
jgi:hypothetical protein